MWVLRHGQSLANVAGVIVSAPGPRAIIEVGLTELGREQARQAALGAARDHGMGPTVRLLSSDFARALQTAEEFGSVLQAPTPLVREGLRERFFGRYDEGPADAYERIWVLDHERAAQIDEVEDVCAVAARVARVLTEADDLLREDPSAPVVLVAHGDVLQIALALASGMDPYDHRQVPHLGNAELRRLGPHRPVVTE